MKVAKLFNHGGSQAVRLPREFRFDGNEVVLSAVPRSDADALVGALLDFEPDVRIQRDQPSAQSRVDISPGR